MQPGDAESRQFSCSLLLTLLSPQVSEEQCTTKTRQRCREEPRQNCRTELQTVCGSNFSFGNNLYGDNLYDGKFYGKRQAPTSALKNSTILTSPGQGKASRAKRAGDNF